MKKDFSLNVGGAILDSMQLEQYLEKLASSHILKKNSDKKTYPIPRLKENISFIWKTYLVLSEDIKNNIPAHPAGEWILDNYYIIDKVARTIIKNLTLKDYTKLIGLMNGNNAGYARSYVVANDIISYTDGKVDGKAIQKYLNAYQSKKTLSMEELWSIPTFLYIALIEKIRQICEKIYLSQMQKHKVESIVSRLIDFETENVKTMQNDYDFKLLKKEQSKYPFIEYMSYRLKKYGKRTYGYIQILEEIVNKTGLTIDECINREHFDIASKKISIGNSITSISMLNRLNYAEIFNNINGVEDVLKKDPCEVYENMDEKTKEYYRKSIEEISKKTKLSELYIAKKCIELAKINYSLSGKKEKASHVGYYLISNGKKDLYAAILNKKTKKNKEKNGTLYVYTTSILSILISCIIGWYLNKRGASFFVSCLSFLLLIIPIKNIIIKIIQYLSSIVAKPKLIPRMDFSSGVPEECSTMVVIPTILKSKEKVVDMMKKLEVYYIANKSDNIYFTLLGDCTSEKNESTSFDQEIVDTEKEYTKILNEKYPDEKYPKFNCIYRKRTWSKSEECFLGWERKRGLLTQFNEYILGKTNNCFLYNSFEEVSKIPKVKYIITLDSDTNLVLNTASQLIGGMAHILNMPTIDKEKNIVTDGYGILTPRVGIGLEESRVSRFTKIFSGISGTDAYTNTISDFYQDNFEEGIYTGKGIYDLEVFYNVLKGEIPEDRVLSHDLLEGCYLKSGFASDVLLMDGFPTSYGSYRDRLSRWIRGDVQIVKWLFSRKLGILSKCKILDNITRSLLEVCAGLLLVLNIFVKSNIICAVSLLSICIPYILELFSKILNKKNGEITQKKFSKDMSSASHILCKIVIEIMLLVDKAVFSLNSFIKAVYRMLKSKKHLLEWTTSEESEKKNKSAFLNLYKAMLVSVLIGFVILALAAIYRYYFYVVVGFLWIIAPGIMSIIGRQVIRKSKLDSTTKDDKKYIKDIGYKTWTFFKDYLNEHTNYLPPDNYQEERKNKIVYRTSPTNIGLALLSVISSYDLGYESKENTITLLEKMLDSIDKLPKWYGHLYNWYNISSLVPLYPRYISSVDSGNFVGYLYVVRQFVKEEVEDIERKNVLLQVINKMIDSTDFSKLFDNTSGLFSIGYNIEENKLTDSYYDLMASESRQTSLVAIAKKDVPAKHWKNLGRTLTILNKYKGLISWSGTSFEYLMPPVIIKRYEGSLLDESCKFMIMSQIEYAKKLGIPWGISEAAFNLKDFNGDYQYKAFGIPWLGLKRGLANEMVVSSYGTILAINDYPDLVLKNLRELEKIGMYDKYGFYESCDYTPSRVKHGEFVAIVKTYMAHHQGLILLSINNLMNNNIMQKRFSESPEIQAVDILLQERMPDNVIITKEKKEKIEKIKYTDYNYYLERRFTEKDEGINEFNIIGNNSFNILCDKCGNGISKFGSIVINRYGACDYMDGGILFFLKDIGSKEIWSLTNSKYEKNKAKYVVSYYSDKTKYSKIYQDIKSELSIIATPEDPVEIRNLQLKNLGDNDKILEISCFFEPILGEINQYYAHKAFSKLFLSFELIDNILVVKRKSRTSSSGDFFMAITLFDTNDSAMEFEINKKDLCGRNNYGIPIAIKESIPFSNSTEQTTNPIVALRKSVDIRAKESKNLSMILSVSYSKDEAISNVKKYLNEESIDRAIKISRAQSEAKIQYLGISGKDVCLYQRILSRCITKYQKYSRKTIDVSKSYSKSKIWKYGISGDNILILLMINSVAELDVVETIIKAIEYYSMLGISADLIIVDTEEESYESFVKESIIEIINNHSFNKSSNDCKICVLNNLDEEEIGYLKVKSNIIFDGNNGKIEFQLDEIDYAYKRMLKNIWSKAEKNRPYEIDTQNNARTETGGNQNLLFYNEYGGFSKDKSEYVIVTNRKKKTPLVWSNVIANSKFGTVITESMGGYTWYKNARLNRITTFSNDPVEDFPSEAIYIKDCGSSKVSSLGVSLAQDEGNYKITHGFGYSIVSHQAIDIFQQSEVFIPINDSCKIYTINLKNILPYKRKIQVFYSVNLSMAEDEIESDGYINLDYYNNSNLITLKNISNDEFKNYAYITCTEKINSFTGSKNEFIGNGSIERPEAISLEKLSNLNTLNNSNMVVISIEVELESLECKDFAIIFGCEANIVDCKNMAYKYNKIERCYKELEDVKKYWHEKSEKIRIETPDEDINTLMNGRVIYQTLSSRMNARSGFYQSGGAYGFRDQLQDSLCLKYIDIEYEKNQIIKHSQHQFIEGDVLHWWHEDTKRGVRTRFSDDYLWLVYVTLDYIDFSGDEGILEIETNYLEGETLEDGVNERYDLYTESNTKESIFNHCLRAVRRACNFGEHGLSKIGSGDWNDGFSNVGVNGIGESVWLSFFLYDILIRFAPICEKMNLKQDADYFRQVADGLKKNINLNAWDGRWYKRAFCDDGSEIGSIHNQECKIDSIAQSWSVISGAGDNDKKYIAMESLENHLIDRENGIIKLLDPPFEKSSVEPGYIKSYLPGTRENGGQYTHAAIWVIIAEAMLGFGDKAFEYLKMISPIEHSKTKMLADKYKVEPYVIAADIYGSGSLAGVGGWTWYTGSSSWYYICVIKYILGINISKGFLSIKPNIPQNWESFKVRYKYGNTIYNIVVNNENKGEDRKKKMYLNGDIVEENKILLKDNGSINEVSVII